MFFNLIFDNYILRVDMNVTCGYSIYGFGSEKQMKKINKILDTLINYYIVRHFTKTRMRKEFRDDAGLQEEIAEYVVDTIEKNYRLLQINYIMDHLNRNDSE